MICENCKNSHRDTNAFKQCCECKQEICNYCQVIEIVEAFSMKHKIPYCKECFEEYQESLKH
jgi:hypothetical protein